MRSERSRFYLLFLTCDENCVFIVRSSHGLFSSAVFLLLQSATVTPAARHVRHSYLSTTKIVWCSFTKRLHYIIIIIIIIIGIQPLVRSGQRPEFSQATGMALVRCILGIFLGVACHCFPPLFRCSHFSPPGASPSATT